MATWSVVCFEQLSLKSLVKTKHAKSWLDAAFGELLRQVEYKALWSSKHFVQVGRFFPSTQLCSGCGYKNDSLSLSDREWTCPQCATPPHAGLQLGQERQERGTKNRRRGIPGDAKRLWTASQTGGSQHRRLKQESSAFRQGSVKASLESTRA